RRRPSAGGDQLRVRGERGHALGRPPGGLGPHLRAPGTQRRGGGAAAQRHRDRDRDGTVRGDAGMNDDAAAGLTTKRVMGIETEFGVVHADVDERTRTGAGGAIALSHLVVGGYALLDENEGTRGRRVRWDYGDETPLRD